MSRVDGSPLRALVVAQLSIQTHALNVVFLKELLLTDTQLPPQQLVVVDRNMPRDEDTAWGHVLENQATDSRGVRKW